MNLFLKFLNIIKGTYRNIIGYSSDETIRRRLICNICNHRVKYMGAYICDLCGCIITSKTTVEDEKCLINKW